MITLFVTLAISITLGILLNHYFIIRFEKTYRSLFFVITLILFVFSGVGLFTTQKIKINITKTIHEKRQLIEDIILEQYPDNIFIQDGVDISEIDIAISEIKAIIPTTLPKEINSGIKTINSVLDRQYQKYLNIAFEQIERKTNLLKRFSKNNIITLDSMLKTLEYLIIKKINFYFIFIQIIIIGILIVYTVGCIIKSNQKVKPAIIWGDKA